ncbi:MAG: zf-HC2 domain-containing protein [Deferrisomatales bacterium]|nr:zf-HC2 domain-containing protein [Deferrisomatales bacterium]
MIHKMSCREILDSLSEFIDAELDPSLCAEIEAHMEGCSPCVAFLNTLKKTVVLYKNCGDATEVPHQVTIDLHRFLRERCVETLEG